MVSFVPCIAIQVLQPFFFSRALRATTRLTRCNMDSTPSPASSAAGSSSSSQPTPTTASSVLRALSNDQPIPEAASGVSKQIDTLLDEQRKLRAQRAQIAKDLKNAQRRKARLKHKARLLSASDLASVLVLRQEEEEARANTAAKRQWSSQPIERAAEGEDVGGGRHGQDSAERLETDVGDEEEAGSPSDPPALT